MAKPMLLQQQQKRVFVVEDKKIPLYLRYRNIVLFVVFGSYVILTDHDICIHTLLSL